MSQRASTIGIEKICSDKPTTTRSLPRSSSHHGHQHEATPPRRKARFLKKASTRRGDKNTLFNLGDGNADREAEELLPSPNFYVHRFMKIPSSLAVGFCSSCYISFSHLSGFNFSSLCLVQQSLWLSLGWTMPFLDAFLIFGHRRRLTTWFDVWGHGTGASCVILNFLT